MNFYNVDGCVIYTTEKLGLEEIKVKFEDQGEKHVPVASLDGNVLLVKVGTNLHPMTLEHHIKFVLVETDKNVYVHNFNPTDEPVACFNLLEGEKAVAVYGYCNLHGVFKKEC